MSNVIVEEAACFDTAGERVLFVNRTSNLAKSSLAQENVEGSETLKVVCTTADRLVALHSLERVDVVKIDTEGADFKVLVGMHATLRRCRPKIIVELVPQLLKSFAATPSDVFQYLEQLGYSVACESADFNYLFVPNESNALPDVLKNGH